MTTEFVTIQPGRTDAPESVRREPRHRAPGRHLIGGASIPIGLVLTLAVVALLVRACT